MREKFAELCHDQWSRWMDYLFSKCYETQIEPTLQEPDGEKVFVIPKWAVDRWTRQMKTKYENLPEDEKESDRKEADRFLALIEQNQHSAQQRLYTADAQSAKADYV